MWYKFIKCFLIKWVYYICNIFILFYGWFFNVYVQVIWPALVNRPFVDGLWIVRSWTDFCKGRFDLFSKSDADRAKLNWPVLCLLWSRPIYPREGAGKPNEDAAAGITLPDFHAGVSSSALPQFSIGRTGLSFGYMCIYFFCCTSGDHSFSFMAVAICRVRMAWPSSLQLDDFV